MYKVSGNAISLTRGDSFYSVLSMKKNGLTYTPVEGDVIRFALKSAEMNKSGTDYKETEPLILKTIPNDTLMLYLAPSDTKTLPFGRYVYDIQITFANGDIDTFIAEVPFTLTREVY